MKSSHYQEAVYKHMANRAGNSAVISVAGSGKTTTALESIRSIPKFYQILLGAFNTDIKKDFESKGRSMGFTHVKYYTYNGFGWGICLNKMKHKPTLDGDKTVKILESIILPMNDKEEAKYQRFCGIVKRLVSLFKSLNIHSFKDADAQYDSIVEHFGFDPPEDEDFRDILIQTFRKCIQETTLCDYDDQKYMPLHLDLNIPKYDQVIIDEFQDTCELELRLMTEAAKGGQFCGLGDPDQAIYGFKGATPDAFDSYIKEFDAVELPLSICYRCPINVVKEAQKIVPRIEWAENAIPGTVDSIKFDQFDKSVREGDFVLCRTTEHLVKRCLQKIQQGRLAKVRGRDLGNFLLALINKCGQEHMLIENFLTRLNEFKTKRSEMLRKLRRESEIDRLDDQCSSVYALADNCHNVKDLINKTNSIFCEDQEHHKGIDFMSLHKSKGLQNKRVWILRPDLLPHPAAKKDWQQKEELRLKYVGTTRSEEELFWVSKEPGEK